MIHTEISRAFHSNGKSLKKVLEVMTDILPSLLNSRHSFLKHREIMLILSIDGCRPLNLKGPLAKSFKLGEHGFYKEDEFKTFYFHRSYACSLCLEQESSLFLTSCFSQSRAGDACAEGKSGLLL